MTTLESIDTAPKNGTVILSNEGTVRYMNNTLHLRIDTGWYLCDIGGNIPKCADDGYDISRAFPTRWIPDALELF